MKKINQKNQKKFSKTDKRILMVLLLVIFIPITVVIAIPYSPFDTSTLYITGNDVITNYRLDSFDGDEIVGGSVPALDDKLKFEPSAFWKTTEDDFEVIEIRESGDIVSIEYFVTIRNKVNIFTNVRLPQAVEKNFATVNEVFRAGTYEHLGLFGHYLNGWTSDLTWTHYDFGDVLQHNLENNLFSGSLKASFDINPNPIPLNFTDADGNQVEKQFDYISINAMWVSDKTVGKLSDDLPEFVELTPAHYELDERNSYTGAGEEGSMTTDTEDDDFSHLWNPDPKLSTPTYQLVDSGILPASVGATLTPTTRDGSFIWDPVTNQKSMEDCAFTYNLGSISPLVYEYFSTLSYYEQTIIIQDYTYWDFLLLKIGSKINMDDDNIQSQTRQVGLHVTNRYIQTEFSVKFKLFTSFKIDLADTEEPDLDLPEEYYDELIWQMLVDGFGGGQTYTEGFTVADLTGIVTIIVIAVVVIIGLYVFMRIGVPLIMFKAGQKSRK